jgi:hypothetical protein
MSGLSASEKEEDTIRRRWFERYFEEILTDQSTEQKIDEREELVTNLITSLHDPWSEIRKSTFKALKRLIQSLSSNTVSKLFAIFLSADSHTSSWQELHGNLLGLRALLPRLSSDHELEQIQQKLLHSLSHPNLPLREVAGSTLLDLIKQSPSHLGSRPLHFVLREIEPRARSDVEQRSEFHSNFLFASLGLVSDLLRDSSSEVTLDFSESYLRVLGLCLAHTSTTVRTQATLTVRALYDQLCPLFSLEDGGTEGPVSCQSLPPSLVGCLSAVVKSANDALSNVLEVSQWRLLEGFLLIIEDMLLRLSLSPCLLLASSPSPSSSVQQPLVAIFRSVVLPLQTFLPALISHPIFEISRLVPQILPSLSRVSVLSALDNSATLSLCSLEDTTAPCVEIILDLEVVKSLCLLHEAFPSPHSQMTAGAALVLCPSPPKWSTVIHRRLAEADRQVLFLQMLTSPSLTPHLSLLVRPFLVQWADTLSQSTDRLIALFAIQLSEGGTLSLDSIHLLAYLSALVSSLLSSSPLNGELTLLFVFRKLFHLLVTTLATFQCHLDCLPSSLTVKCIDALTSCQHLTTMPSNFSADSPGSSEQLSIPPLSEFIAEKEISPLLLQKYLWELLLPLCPFLLSPPLFQHLLTGTSTEFGSESLSPHREIYWEVLTFLRFALLNSSPSRSMHELLWSGCCTLALHPSPDPHHPLLELFSLMKQERVFSHLEEELRMDCPSHRGYRPDCEVISLVLMIDHAIKLSAPEKRLDLHKETLQLHGLICGRIHVAAEAREDDNDDGEFSDWDESDEEDGQRGKDQDMNFLPILKHYIAESESRLNVFRTEEASSMIQN